MLIVAINYINQYIYSCMYKLINCSTVIFRGKIVNIVLFTRLSLFIISLYFISKCYNEYILD